MLTEHGEELRHRKISQLGFFSERPPIPTMVQHALKDGKELGDETDRASKTGFVREMEVEIVMSKTAAVGFLKWLEVQVNELP